jgi:hypothetical protein
MFALALMLSRHARLPLLGSENLINPLPPTSLTGMPMHHRNNWEVQSFAGRPQFEIRGPYGPNPDQKYIQDQSFFDNDYYQKRYQKDKFQMDIKNQDWRLDPTTFGTLNGNYAIPHQPEDNLAYIKEFAECDTRSLNQNEEFF